MRVHELLKKYNLYPKKNFGQNFLVDDFVLDKIMAAAQVGKEELVLEIGPGLGTLTRQLAPLAGKVIAVEIDKGLIPVLEAELGAFSNVEILNQDILAVDLPALLETSGFQRVKVIANLPYYISTVIIMNFLELQLLDTQIDSMVFMVQKEVGKRMLASPGSADYGALSLAVQYRSLPHLVANVPNNCFMPRPTVDSAVIRLEVLPKEQRLVVDEKLLFALIKAGFSSRRKTLVNCLHQLLPSDDKALIKTFLAEAGFDENIRGEVLSLTDYQKLAELFPKHFSA